MSLELFSGLSVGLPSTTGMLQQQQQEVWLEEALAQMNLQQAASATRLVSVDALSALSYELR